MWEGVHVLVGWGVGGGGGKGISLLYYKVSPLPRTFQDVRVLLPVPPMFSGGRKEESEELLGNLDLGLDLSDALHGIKFGQDLPDTVGR